MMPTAGLGKIRAIQGSIAFLRPQPPVLEFDHAYPVRLQLGISAGPESTVLQGVI